MKRLLGGKMMRKEQIVAIVLKVIALIIILIGVRVFIEYRLWSDSTGYLKAFVPILVLGFSGTLYGLATLLNKNRN